MIKNATFTSVWDDSYSITTNCKVNTATREVFNIEESSDDNIEKLDTLTSEYVTIDGIDYPVFNIDEPDVSENTFWYR